ncbi:hypothetical protein ROZALSC1DRAFT_28535 [Rozella allomycis CSF55]|uniref:K Homology domain-containing protein n=1 Tax=Rozella allomycis (strain CSF55) TaxID=988480 RepID=A0A075AZR5_ROZAC|nr:hypothetical protein O9G_005355 [Rozella allomycis CSF55]RKP19912.1 hypothetical protein ROZALSC1DRAFT_28535 [Rozella allomycis CSF55]|eukprot:EPZ35763.1 hypothetical protein O9G_005355 [Rozella allomycis CSF55]
MQREAYKAAKEAAVRIQASLRSADKGPSLTDSLLQEEKFPIKMRGEYPYSTKIDINDSKHRYNLARVQFHEMIFNDTGAIVICRGRFYPDRRMATEREPTMYLHIASPNKEAMERAVEMINAVMKQVYVPPNDKELRGLVAKVFVHVDPEHLFNFRGKLLGPGGANLKFVNQQTGAKVQLRGRGSGFLESATGTEAAEALHLFVTASGENAVEQARRLCQDLVTTVRNEYFKQQSSTTTGPSYNYGDYNPNLAQPSLPPAPPGLQNSNSYYQNFSHTALRPPGL